MIAALLWCSPSIALADSYVKSGWKLLSSVEMKRTEVTLEIGVLDPQPIAIFENPPVQEARYLVAGEVKYETASGYLEMWNIFGNARYFSRTLGETGRMAKLEGTADWRPFMLPFNADSGRIPERLEINVVLPGGGKVELRNVNLYETNSSLLTPQAALWENSKLPVIALAFILVLITAIAWWRCLQRERAKRELRAMTASDLTQ